MMFKRPFARATQTGFTFCSRSYGHKRYDEMSELAYHMFSDGSFEVVISRVSLPYMRLPAALREIVRVLRPGGQVWFTLHPISTSLLGVARSLKERNAKNLAHQLYVIVNGLFFHFTGRLFRSPFNRAKCESFQTARGIVRAMRAAGFDQVRAERGRFLVVTASKQG